MPATEATGSGEKALTSLKRNLSGILDSGKYSDLTIRLSNGQEWKCHRAILCGQCQFFANAVKPGNFKEGETGVIEMKNDSPVAVQALLEFLYTAEYGDIYLTGDNSSDIVTHSEVYAIARVYDVPLLADEALRHMTWVLRRNSPTRASLPAILHAVRTVYDSTPENKCGMRTILHSFMASKVDWLMDGQLLNQWMKEVPDFMAAVMKLYWRGTKR